MASTWEITWEQKQKPALKYPVLIEGLPGIGNVGKIAVDFMIEELKAEKLCSFFSYSFPQSVFVNERNLIDMPKIELYVAKGKGSRPDLLFLAGDIQPLDEEGCFLFCEEILALAREYQSPYLITTGGIGLQQVPEDPRVFCAANSSSLLKEFKKKEWGVQPNIFGVVGPIIGVSGVLLGLGKKRRVPGIALLAETFAHPMYLGIKGAKELLRVFNAKFSLGLDLKKMSNEIIEVEKELQRKSKEWIAELATRGQARNKMKDGEVSYIG